MPKTLDNLPAIYAQRFAPLKLPTYTFKEFPKRVIDPRTKKSVRVMNAEEEFRVLNGDGVVRESDERAALVVQARNKGVQIDESWPIDRIREEITEHDEIVQLVKAQRAAAKAKREEEARKVLSGKASDEDPEKARLVRLAEVKGVKVDRRKGAEAIAQAIRDAGFDDAEAA